MTDVLIDFVGAIVILAPSASKIRQYGEYTAIVVVR